MKQLTWPTAFALTFAGLPAFVFAVAVIATNPLVGWPLLASGAFAYGAYRRHVQMAELAARAELLYPANAALVAAPLPEMPTVPLRRPLRAVDSKRRVS